MESPHDGYYVNQQSMQGLEFVKGVISYQKKLKCATKVPKSLKLDKELEQKINVIVRSFSLAKNQEHNFLRLMQMGATMRNASSYMEKLKLNAKIEKLARVVMGKMTIEQFYYLNMSYNMMGQICSNMLEMK
ncbi:hypothetical protein Hanom_Chr06g00540091 [Helianthus anomalus]